MGVDTSIYRSIIDLFWRLNCCQSAIFRLQWTRRQTSTFSPNVGEYILSYIRWNYPKWENFSCSLENAQPDKCLCTNTQPGTMLDQLKVNLGHQINWRSNDYDFSYVCWPLCTQSTKHIEDLIWCCFEQCRQHLLAWVEVRYQDRQTYGINIAIICGNHNIWKLDILLYSWSEVCKELCNRQSLHETLWKTTRIQVCFI